MSDETIRTLITALATLSGVIVTQIFSYLNTKNADAKSHKREIQEQQYMNIYMPIDKELRFNKDIESCLKCITQIITDNYALTPEKVRLAYFECRDLHIITTDFIFLIRTCCKLLEIELGYSNLKLNKEEKKRIKGVSPVFNISLHSDYKILLLLAILLLIMYIIFLLNAFKIITISADFILSACITSLSVVAVIIMFNKIFSSYRKN